MKDAMNRMTSVRAFRAMGVGVCMAWCTACGGFAEDSAAADDYVETDPPIPAGTGTGTGTTMGGATTTGGGEFFEPDTCMDSAVCGEGLFCVAPFAGTHRGAFECTADCVVNDDQELWCRDDTACCDPAARCNARGLCVADDGGDTDTDG